MASPPARFPAREAGRAVASAALRSASPRRIVEAWGAVYGDRPMVRRRGTGPILLSLAEARALGAWLQQQAARRQPDRNTTRAR